MKKKLVIIKTLVFLFLIPWIVTSQEFEGKITYKNTYISKSKDISNEQLTNLMGDIQEYYFKKGNYKSLFNGDFMQLLLYLNSENRIYNKFSTSDNYYWSDGSVEGEDILNYEFYKNKETILGYLCDELIVYTKMGTYTYYFNTDLKINSNQFLNHNYANWNFYIEKAKALPLKIIMDVREFKSYSVAINIDETKIKEDLFFIPNEIKKLPITELENK